MGNTFNPTNIDGRWFLAIGSEFVCGDNASTWGYTNTLDLARSFDTQEEAAELGKTIRSFLYDMSF
jgi:hypothetical protein